MTPEEWRQGMENEASSVQDAAWSRATRRAALQPVAWSLQVGIYGLLLAGLGYALTILTDHAIRFSVLRDFNPVGEWVMTHLGYTRLFELGQLFIPALLAGMMALLRFTPGLLAVLGGLAFLPMGVGAWLYTSTHEVLSYPTLSGTQTVNLAGYAGGFSPERLVMGTLLIGFCALVGHRLRRALHRSRA
ncbi:hypothetical protein [Deinococcus multiflagellatus]|uniref:Uncharacterized protein n=1 Tax=Deinococcus multiflagellatus TaxID=1656887 RepID=A0ABW1ZHV5_9DEIO|nr:hypothetical protein [Deinococcus multiflagellatus]MBZ9711703.1 hypothetical protein [Deinococcus multiflagellatus]